VSHPLDRLWFEWHDLPVDRISIVERGVTIDVRPFDDDADRYEHATLSLLDATAIAFDVQGELALKDLARIEITDFDVEESAPGRITGLLGILYGGTGYWTIRITNALWQLEPPSHLTRQPVPEA
jgi:hypothetical protein